MDINIITALIGVGSTIAGTLLGWILNSASNRGNLNIYVANWSEKLDNKSNSGYGVPMYAEAVSRDSVNHYSYSGSIDIYNSSNNTKIMRDFKIVHFDGKRILKETVPIDDSTKHIVAEPLPAMYDSVGVINIPPKSVISINLHKSIGQSKDDVDFLWNSKTILVQYKDEKNNIKTKKIIDCNYDAILNNNFQYAQQ